jgi:histidine triad (HIT) family protein
MDCIFCKIVKGEIPCYKVYEDSSCFAFLDINPFVKGHVLIVPKKHYHWLWDMKDEDYIPLMQTVKLIANKLKLAFNIEWVEEVVAGIGVEHAHVHLLPRRPDDGLPEVPSKPLEPKLSKEEMEELKEKIATFL